MHGPHGSSLMGLILLYSDKYDISDTKIGEYDVSDTKIGRE
jgi:hypothetical protein